MTASSTLLTALVAAATAVVVALFTQFATWRRERAQRTYERRRSALLDAQDAGLAVRNRVTEFGQLSRSGLTTRPDPRFADTQRRLDDALATFTVRLTRVDDQAVVRAAHAWRERATYHSISREEVTDAEEIEAWQAMNAGFGAALRSATGVSAGQPRGSAGSS